MGRACAVAWMVVGGVVSALAACGDDDPVAGSGGAGGTSIEGGANAGGEGGSVSDVTFVVVLSLTGDTTFPPLEGATVAFDMPDGERVEQMSGADGRVTFSGIDWSGGQAAVTAHLDGYALYSVVHLDEASLSQAFLVRDAMPLHMVESSPAAPPTVTVSGTLIGLEDVSHSVAVNVVGTTVAGSEDLVPGNGTFTVTVPLGQPFSLQALEVIQSMPLPSGQGYDFPIFQVMQQTFDPISTNVTDAVLDFAVGTLPTFTADLTVSLPERPESPVRNGDGVALVCPLNSAYCTGWATYLDVSGDGNAFEAAMLWVEPAWAEGTYTLVRVHDASGAVRSIRSIDGWPTSGLIGHLPDIPEWIEPSNPIAAHPLHNAFEWELFERDVPHVQLNVFGATGLLWIVAAGRDATTLTVPEPPSTVDPPFFATPLEANLVVGWPDPSTNTFDALSLSTRVGILP